MISVSPPESGFHNILTGFCHRAASCLHRSALALSATAAAPAPESSSEMLTLRPPTTEPIIRAIAAVVSGNTPVRMPVVIRTDKNAAGLGSGDVVSERLADGR